MPMGLDVTISKVTLLETGKCCYGSRYLGFLAESYSV